MASASVPIELDKSRSLVFDMEAVEALEVALNGIPLMDIVQRLRGVSLPTLVIALWAGLKKDDKALTLNLTKKIVNKCIFEQGRTYAELCEPVADAINKCGMFGSQEAEPGNEKAAETAA